MVAAGAVVVEKPEFSTGSYVTGNVSLTAGKLTSVLKLLDSEHTMFICPCRAANKHVLLQPNMAPRRILGQGCPSAA
jgi:hypothetical protein